MLYDSAAVTTSPGLEDHLEMLRVVVVKDAMGRLDRIETASAMLRGDNLLVRDTDLFCHQLLELELIVDAGVEYSDYVSGLRHAAGALE